MIHPTAFIDPSSQIADDVAIGAFSVVGPEVIIDSGCELKNHVSIQGPCKIGKNNRFFPFSSIGDEPQDKKFHNEHTFLEIGDDNTFRENVTINRGTEDAGGITKIGSRNWIMAYVHIAHDCILGDDIIMANAASLAGHVTLENHAILGGFSLIHQFCRVGAHAFTSMGSVVNRDVPPYVTASGHMAEPRGINSEGLKRRDFTPEQISNIKKAYRILYKSELRLQEALEQLGLLAESDSAIKPMISFIETSERSVIR